MSFVPTWGVALIFDVSIIDALGQTWNFHESIPIIGSPSCTFLPTSQSVWQQGSEGGLRLTVDADFDDFLNIAVDGEICDTGQYLKERGSTIITLLPAYLNTLPVEEHVLKAYFRTGCAEIKFIIIGATLVDTDTDVDVPETGDNAAPYLWGGLLLFAGTSLPVITFRRKARNKKGKKYRPSWRGRSAETDGISEYPLILPRK